MYTCVWVHVRVVHACVTLSYLELLNVVCTMSECTCLYFSLSVGCSGSHSDRDQAILHPLQHPGGPEGLHGEGGEGESVWACQLLAASGAAKVE